MPVLSVICSCSTATHSQAWLSERYTPCRSFVRIGATGHPGSSLQPLWGVYTSPFFWPWPPEYEPPIVNTCAMGHQGPASSAVHI